MYVKHGPKSDKLRAFNGSGDVFLRKMHKYHGKKNQMRQSFNKLNKAVNLFKKLDIDSQDSLERLKE